METEIGKASVREKREKGMSLLIIRRERRQVDLRHTRWWGSCVLPLKRFAEALCDSHPNIVVGIIRVIPIIVVGTLRGPGSSSHRASLPSSRLTAIIRVRFDFFDMNSHPVCCRAWFATWCRVHTTALKRWWRTRRGPIPCMSGRACRHSLIWSEPWGTVSDCARLC